MRSTDHAPVPAAADPLARFAGGVAHEFNNLLAGMMGCASLAQMDVPEGSPAAEALADVQRAGERATALTAQLLAYAGRGLADRKACALVPLVTDVLASRKADTRVVAEHAGGLPSVLGEERRLRHLVRVLVENAVESLGATGGRVEVRTWPLQVDAACRSALTVNGGITDGPHVVLEVEDSGCGMSAETLAQAFQPYFSTKRSGRGLGLANVHATVRQHKGAIQVSSREGHGTRVRVLLPAAPGAQ